MPYSSSSGKPFTTETIKKILNTYFPYPGRFSVLDVGPGIGTYSDLYRNLLPGKWVACEIWEPYVSQYQLNNKYDQVIVDDIRNSTFDIEDYDFIFLGDVLEHMSKEEAIAVVEKFIHVSKFLIISIPIIKYPQGEYQGNPHEAHVKDDWSHQEVLNTWGNYIKLSHVEKDTGVYFLSNQLNIIPQIAVYGIFKNEAKFIERMLMSCIHADQIVFCDTGSTDGTMEILHRVIESLDEVTAKKIRLEKITVLPWRFDDARNTALTFVDPNIDLCISLDADEFLMPGWKQELINNYKPEATRYYHRFCTFWNEEETNKSEHWHDRIHLRKGYKWSLPVHEILEIYSPDPGKETVQWLNNFFMYQKPDTTKDRGSYLSLLEKSVKERSDIWKSWSFLASEYYSSGRVQDALDTLEKAMALPDADKGYLYNFKATMMNNVGRWDQAIEALRTAIGFSPTIREFNVYLAEIYENQYARTGDPVMLQLAKLTITHAELIIEKSTGYLSNDACWGESFEQIKNRIISK